MKLTMASWIPTFVALSVILILSQSNASSEAPKVKLALYYESLCHGCQFFITNYLNDAVLSDLTTITDFHLVPYGNAHFVNTSVECQHGPKECYFNTIEACAMHIWPDLKSHYGFINCVELELHNDGDEQVWKSCCKKLNMSTNPISNCLYGDLGAQLITKNRVETENLEPPIEFVPWVTVDGVAIRRDLREFVAHVCKAYKGKKLPEACNNSHINYNEYDGVLTFCK